MSAHQPITAAPVREYWRTHDAVIAAHRAGYHLPYNNLHDDQALWEAYSNGFADALDVIAKGRAA